MLSISYFCLCCFQIPLAFADLFRRNPDSDSVERAIRLDPIHPYAYTLRAELEDQRGQDSTSSWRKAAHLAPRDPESRIRLALISESKGEYSQAERLLVEAATLSQTWFPRWSLANFYSRRMNRPAALHWAREAALRAGGDLRPLFRLIETHAVQPVEMIRQILPTNRRVRADFLHYRAQLSDTEHLDFILHSLLECIPQQPTGWPGLDVSPWLARNPQRFPLEPIEQSAIFAALDRMLTARSGEALFRLQKSFADKLPGLIPTFDRHQPLPAHSLSRPIGGSPLDWRFMPILETSVDVDLAKLELQIELTGRQSETYDIGGRVILLPSSDGWQFECRSRCLTRNRATGLWWELRDLKDARLPIASIEIPSSVSTLPLQMNIAGSPVNRLCYLALCFRRRPGILRLPMTASIHAPTIVERKSGHRP